MDNINNENLRYSCNDTQAIISPTHNIREKNCLLIGDKAPTFSSNTTFGECKLNDYIGKWLVFFSYPENHATISTTELIAFSNYYNEFKKINCELLGISSSNITSHLSWIYNIYKSTGITIPFPIIDDKQCKVLNTYNMLNNNTGIPTKNIYIICPEGKIRAILKYPDLVGINVIEILRIISALQENDTNKVATPANWIPGTPTISLVPQTQSEMLKNCNEYNYTNIF